MAPVTGRIANGEENGLIFHLRSAESLVRPRIPVYWLMGVLEKIGALFVEEDGLWLISGFPYNQVCIKIPDWANLFKQNGLSGSQEISDSREGMTFPAIMESPGRAALPP